MIYSPLLSRVIQLALKTGKLAVYLLLLTVAYVLVMALLGGGKPFEVDGVQEAFSLSMLLSHFASLVLPLPKGDSVSLNSTIPSAVIWTSAYSFLVALPSVLWLAVVSAAPVSPVVGLRVKAIDVDPDEGKGRQHQDNAEWASREQTTRAADYGKLFRGKEGGIPTSVLDDSDLPNDCKYSLLIVYSRKYVFWGDITAYASARIYQDSRAIQREFSGALKLASGVENDIDNGECTLIDRLSVNPREKPKYAAKIGGVPSCTFRAMLLAVLYKEALRHSGSSTLLGLARRSEGEHLLLRYAPLQPQVVGVVSYQLGGDSMDFWALVFDRHSAKGRLSAQINVLGTVVDGLE
ncbi:MAG: hypothetical protein AAF790_04235 [Planctomycetota bacterium]